MKILISGGHLTPALALIDFIKKNHKEDKIIFVGRIYSQDDLKQLAQEKKEIEKRQIKFIHLKAAKTVRKKSILHKLFFPFLLTKSIISALVILIREKPNVFISFGGYLAIPLAIAAKFTHTKILTHEQTHAAGFANQFIAKLADVIAISYPASAAYFPQIKTHLIGNLIRSELLNSKAPQPEWISQKSLQPILLITGGSQGAEIINDVIEISLPKLTQEWTVIHLCGSSNVKSNYKQQLEQAKSKLPIAQQHNYFIKEWASGIEMSWIYNRAHAAISRAGANTVMELTLKNIPTIFIPLLNSHHDEQLKNAQKLSNQKAALLLTQENLSSQMLMSQLKELKKNHQKILKKLQLINITTDPVDKISQLSLNLHHAA